MVSESRFCSKCILCLAALTMIQLPPLETHAEEPQSRSSSPDGGENDSRETTAAVQLSVLPRLAIQAHFSSFQHDLRPVVFYVDLNDTGIRDLQGQLRFAGFYEFVVRTTRKPGRPINERGTLLDPATRFPAAKLYVHVADVQGNLASGTADYYVGGEWAADFRFQCEKRDGKWRLVKWKMTAVS